MNALSKLALKPADTQLAPTLTLADAERILASWTDLPPGRAQKMRTALAAAAKALAPTLPAKSAAAVVRMDCPTLSRLLQAPPATFGLSLGRRTSLCSELRYMLRRLDRHEPDSRGKALASKALQTCLKALPELRQHAVIDFLRFLDGERIAPGAADGDTLCAYQSRCAERTLCADPAARARQVASSWNWAQQNVLGWPGKLLTRAGRADRYSLRLETYPASFQHDLDRYTDRLQGRDIEHLFAVDLFDETGRPSRRAQRPLRPASIHSRRWILRCAAGALVNMGVEPQELRTLRDLVDPLDHAKAILRFFLDRRGGLSSSMTDKVAQTLRLLARDYCNLPDDHVAALAAWESRVALPEPTGLTEKNTKRLRVLMQPTVRAMLLCFPTELMKRVSVPDIKPEEAARLAMYAVAMEILLICPMRRGNLAGLRLDRHLHQPDPRQRKFTYLCLSADEVKNDRAIEWPIPPESAKLIERYVTRHRPHLVEPGNPYLFGAGDKQRSAQYLGEWLSQAVTRETGAEWLCY